MAAALRGDHNELARVAGCATYTTWRLADTHGTRHGIGYAVHTACCHLLEAAGMWLRLSGAGCGLGLEGKPPEVVAEATDWAMSAALVWAFIFDTKRKGWQAFCETLGIDADAWLASLPGGFLLNGVEGMVDGLVPSAERVLEYLKEIDPDDTHTGVLTAEKFKGDLMSLVEEFEAVWS
ncbi:MAG: hypothetical protein U0836_09245 [Pirellulales bacterium]